MKKRTLLLVLLLLVCRAFGEDRIVFPAAIDGWPVELAIDTGFSQSILFRSSALRMGLIRKEVAKSQRTSLIGIVTNLNVRLAGHSVHCTFGIINPPAALNMKVDGIVGWPFLRRHVLRIDGRQKEAWISDVLPSVPRSWARWKVLPDANLLVLQEEPGRRSNVRMGIDTGSPDGVWLEQSLWQSWLSKHPTEPLTLGASWMASEGLITYYMTRASRLKAGPISLKDVPVAPARPGFTAAFDHSALILGLYALRQLQLVVDGPHGVAYTTPSPGQNVEYSYNRAGAVFTPIDLMNSADLTAHVAPRSSAFRAGVRDGDVLLKIGDLDVTRWRNDPTILPLSRFWAQPAGTTLLLKLRRGGTDFQAALTLRRVPLSPDPFEVP